MATAIIVKSYFKSSGYLSPDSTNYLALAQNLLENNSFFVSAYGLTGKEREFFAIWPMGYPFFIFIISKITGLSVFWASKLLNILLIGIILKFFRSLFNKSAYVYGLIFLFSSYLEIFTYTWSETLFITALVYFSTSMYLFISSNTVSRSLYISIGISSLVLFMSRYIGAFSFGLIGLLGLYYGIVKKDKTKSFTLIGVAILNISLMILYLYHNYLETGFPTGMPRIPSPESNFELLYSLKYALLDEASIISHRGSNNYITLLQFSMLSFFVWLNRKNILGNNTENKNISLPVTFGIIGLTYLFFIILMRWVTQFDDYNYRLLAPGSFLIFIAVINVIEKKTSTVFFNTTKIFLLVVCFISLAQNARITNWSVQKNNGYLENTKNIEKKYNEVKRNSIVIFGERDLKYLRTDLQIRYPFKLPYHAEKEMWNDFLHRIEQEKNNSIYLNIPKKQINESNYHISVVEKVRDSESGLLIHLQ
tara:strand:+ start:4070 stop:5506 length:1437 start_codon:yes stop_codon:yes gene_type:complete